MFSQGNVFPENVFSGVSRGNSDDGTLPCHFSHGGHLDLHPEVVYTLDDRGTGTWEVVGHDTLHLQTPNSVGQTR